MRLLISGGASGGHVSAALAVAEAFRARHPEGHVLMVGRRGGVEEQMVPGSGFALETIDISGLDRDVPTSNVRLPHTLPSAFGHGLRILDRFCPDVVLGVGAHAMVPCLWAALRRGVPYVLQVSEACGLANHMLRPAAAAACVSFQDDVAAFCTPRTVFTSYPIRRGFARREPAAPARRLLIMGGSLGAMRLNRVVWDALDDLLGRFEEVVHLTGGQGAADGATHARPRYRQISTLTDVAGLMTEVDLVVCRAGRGTCAELTAVGLPAVLVPGAFGGGHQEHNAAHLVRAGAAIRIDNDELTPERLLHELRDLSPERLRAMATASAELGAPSAADHIVDVVIETAFTAAPMPHNRLIAALTLVRGIQGHRRRHVTPPRRSSTVVAGDGRVQQLLREV
jgi:UDP-N-acetylglucosamine--N-acetylmuramyl-(pentapeptide) pyrophosphoryl-undecaprenol N-acetylglucosamine transferase